MYQPAHRAEAAPGRDFSLAELLLSAVNSLPTPVRCRTEVRASVCLRVSNESPGLPGATALRERMTGIEPATFCLASRRPASEPHPHGAESPVTPRCHASRHARPMVKARRGCRTRLGVGRPANKVPRINEQETGSPNVCGQRPPRTVPVIRSDTVKFVSERRPRRADRI